LLLAPEFLFAVERAERDPAGPRRYRLDGYTNAARLSFLLWDSAPDPSFSLRRATALSILRMGSRNSSSG
jgi:hypothetical protein